MRRLVAPALAALSLATAAVPATASDALSVAVNYADLDLTTTAGQQALETRISAAVKSVCPDPYSRDLKAKAVWEACKDAALDGAHSQLGWEGTVNGYELDSLVLATL